MKKQSKSESVFVFGSNTEGRHGKGAALHARRRYGAIYGQARGRQHNAYAIVTKELRSGHSRVQVSDIESEVHEFLAHAVSNPTTTFIVTRLGCGLAGFLDDEIAPLFRGAPVNCILPDEWIETLHA